MPQAATSEDLHDIAAGILTPFAKEDPDTVRYDYLKENARWLFDSGIRLFLACANISEYHSLSYEERVNSVRVARNSLPEDATVLGGVGGSTKSATAMAQEHESHGANGIMMMPPDHAFKHKTGVVEHYHRIADAVEISAVPYLRGMNVSVEMIERIADHANVIGIKWAIPNIELFSRCVNRTGKEVSWLCGMGEPPAPAYYFEGASGFSAGVSNFAPKLGLALLEALETTDYEHAKEIRNISVPLMNLRRESDEEGVYSSAYSIPVVKAGLKFAGQHGGPVREPLTDLPDRRLRRVQEMYCEMEQKLDTIGI